MVRILNKELFPTPKDAEIARLKYLVKRFREYDKKRTADYHRVCNELKWYKEELDCLVKEKKASDLIKSLRERVGKLEELIETNEYKEIDLSNDKIYMVFKENMSLRKGMAKKDARMSELHKQISELKAELKTINDGKETTNT